MPEYDTVSKLDSSNIWRYFTCLHLRSQATITMMVSLSLKSLALKWGFFCKISSMVVFEEYSPLYYKQLGLSAAEVGLTSLLGVPLLFGPLVGYLSDKFRARKLCLFISILGLVVLLLAPLLPLVVTFQRCNVASNAGLINQTGDLQDERFYHDSASYGHRKVLENQTDLFVFKARHSTLDTKLTQGSFREMADASRRNDYLSWLVSPIFLYIALSRGIYEILKRAVTVWLNVATFTYIKKERASYGSYYCWGQIGASISLFSCGMIASRITYDICGVVGNGYFVAFPLAAFTNGMTLLALPWITFEYLEHRVIKWTEVKNVVFSYHYSIILFITMYFGCCFTFQQHWEYWYIEDLSGSPVVMGVGGLIRRPLVAISFLLSGRVVNRLGDLQTMALALFLYAVSLFSLSFIRIPWLVLLVDVFQAAGHALSISASVIHFSKAGTTASSSTIQGK